MQSIEYLDEQCFSWSRWRAGGPLDVVDACRKDILISSKNILRKHVVGYCNAEGLICRPKYNHKAVMFFKDDRHFWFHLRNEEFDEIFL